MKNPEHTGSRVNTLSLLLSFILTFTAYAWSTSSSVMLEDDGYFILSAYFNGISHPPGYPLYTLLAHLATFLPTGSMALRVHLLSSLFGSLACLMLWKIVYLLCRNSVAATAAAICLGFSGIFWSQAIISEVYTLNILLVLILLYLCTGFSLEKTGSEKKQIIRMCLVYGLALSNHWPLVVLSTPMFIFLLLKRWKSFISNILPGIPYLLLGLTPYLWMVLRSQANPEISFYGSIDSIQDLWFFITRQGYSEIDYSPSAGWVDKLAYLQFALRETVFQFGWISLPLILAGLIYTWKKGGLLLFTALGAGYLGSTLLLILLLDFDYDEYHVAIFRVYPIVSYAVSSIWIGLGFYIITRYVNKLLRSNPGRSFVTVSLFIILTGTTFSTNLPRNYRGQDNWAELYAKVLLDSLPENSILFLRGDANVGSIGYLNKIENYRNDIDLYHVTGQVFNNRLYRPFKTEYEDMINRIDRFILSTDRDIYYTESLIHHYGIEDFGLYFRIIKNRNTDYLHPVTTPHLLAYWITLADNKPPDDIWKKIHYYEILSDGCRVLNNILLHTTQNNSLINSRDKVCNNLPGILTRIQQNLYQDQTEWDKIQILLESGENFLHQAILKKHSGYYYYYKGLVAESAADKSGAEFYFKRSIHEWNHPYNPAHRKLAEIYD